MAKKSEIVDLSFYAVVHETDKAYLVDFDNGKDAVWIPKSQCEIDDEDKIITMSATLAEEKGIEDNAI